MSHLPYMLFVSLLITLICELAFAWIAKKRKKHDLLLVLLVNVLTNPAVVLIYALLSRRIHTVLLKLVLELAAISVEAYYYKKYALDFPRPFLFSIGANAFSFFFGILLQQIL